MTSNIKAMRRAKRLTQAEVATRAKISQPSYSNIENGKKNPKLTTIQSIANALNCTIDELLTPDNVTATNNGGEL